MKIVARIELWPICLTLIGPRLFGLGPVDPLGPFSLFFILNF